MCRHPRGRKNYVSIDPALAERVYREDVDERRCALQPKMQVGGPVLDRPDRLPAQRGFARETQAPNGCS